ncbi:unnamed protein product, partial [marine sediment metagenome]
TLNSASTTEAGVMPATSVVEVDLLAASDGIFNGITLDNPAFTVASDGATITASIEQSGGGDLRVIFEAGLYDWDTTPADTVSLTPGTDTVPVQNWVYLLESTKVLTASTVGWPATEHAKVGTVVCQTAATLATDGAMKVHAWTDHDKSTDDMGHIVHINAWIREQPATWQSGVVLSPTVNVGPTPDTATVATTTGIVLQLHDHTYPAFDTSAASEAYVINDSVTPYTTVQDFATLLTDSVGGSLSGRRYNLVVWGVVSEATADCKLFVNLPDGSYGTNTAAINDAEHTSIYTIPSDYRGCGFLISRLTVRHQTTGGGQWSVLQNEDLRGLYPSTSPGGGASQTQFSDAAFAVFNDADNTKAVDLDVSAVTTATTRTITIPDS